MIFCEEAFFDVLSKYKDVKHPQQRNL